MNNYSKIIKIPTYSDERGFLTVMENILPFKIERIYWIYGADKQIEEDTGTKLPNKL